MRTPLQFLGICILLASQVAVAQRPGGVPQPTGYVVDQADVLSPREEASLSAQLAALDESSSVQLAVVTVPSLGGASAEFVSGLVFNSWGVGQKGVNNGGLILLAPTEQGVYLQVGTGLEWEVPDYVASDIVSQMVSEFQAGSFGRGIETGVQILARRASSVRWDVDYRTAYEIECGGGLSVGQILLVRGLFVNGSLESEWSGAETVFPPHWGEVYGLSEDGERASVIARVASVEPLRFHALGIQVED